MAASTVFFFLRLGSFAERYKAALCFTGLVTFIAMYHYFRIFDSFNAAFTPCEIQEDGSINYNHCDPEKFVYNLFVGLKESQEAQPEECKDAVKWACWATVFSWCTYPIVFIMPMLGGSSDGKAGLSAGAMVSIQVGYTASDIISKCGVGYLVYRIGLAKSMAECGGHSEEKDSLTEQSC